MTDPLADASDKVLDAYRWKAYEMIKKMTDMEYGKGDIVDALSEIPSLSEVIDGGGDGDDSDSDDDEDILEEALRITRGDRNALYGPPDQDFERTARIWSAIKGVDFEAREVAMFMVALKLSRETHQRKRDNWVDIAGYARCGSLCR